MPFRVLRYRYLVAVLLSVLFVPIAAAESPTFPAAPGPDDGLVDVAEWFSDGGAVRVRKGTEELTSKGTPTHVVTISSLEKMGASKWTVRAYAEALFESWAASSGSPLPRDSSVLVVVFVASQRVVLALGSSHLAHAAEAPRAEEVFAHYLDEDPDRALAFEKGLEAVAAVLEGKSPTLPGAHLLTIVLVVVFGLLALTVVDYLRTGARCWTYRVWSGVFSILSASIAWALTRSVDLGTSLTSSDDAPASDPGIVLGRW